MQKQLVRMDDTGVELEDLDDDLYQQAAKTLGYHVGWSSVVYKAATAQVLAGCKQAGCRNPFTMDSVKVYKEKMAPRIGPLFYALTFLSMLLGIALIVFAGLSVGALDSGDTNAVRSLAFYFTLPSLFTFVVVMSLRRSIYGTNFGKHWRQVLISDYKEPIPEFALQTAIDLKKVFPTAKFLIETLEETRDPFLVMCYTHPADGQSLRFHFYLEVWNEPSYKQERMV